LILILKVAVAISTLAAGALAQTSDESALNAGSAQPRASGPRITQELIDEIDALIPKEMSFFEVAGAGMALVQDGKVVYARGFGVRNAETGEPFTADKVLVMAN
jgi:CubicO group peptidase (beta-lactamase class C family)